MKLPVGLSPLLLQLRPSVCGPRAGPVGAALVLERDEPLEVRELHAARVLLGLLPADAEPLEERSDAAEDLLDALLLVNGIAIWKTTLDMQKPSKILLYSSYPGCFRPRAAPGF